MLQFIIDVANNFIRKDDEQQQCSLHDSMCGIAKLTKEMKNDTEKWTVQRINKGIKEPKRALNHVCSECKKRQDMISKLIFKINRYPIVSKQNSIFKGLENINPVILERQGEFNKLCPVMFPTGVSRSSVNRKRSYMLCIYKETYYGVKITKTKGGFSLVLPRKLIPIHKLPINVKIKYVDARRISIFGLDFIPE